MPGIYIHIPFCRSKCPYCNFFSVASGKHIHDLADALIKEMGLRKGFFGNSIPSTLYFGGGTPSFLDPGAISRLIECARQQFGLSVEAEITLEANPDDISPESLKAWKNAGVNRLSIGIQSFSDQDLSYLGRKHTSDSAEKAMLMSMDHGFPDLSVDFIYGVPGQDDDSLSRSLNKAISAGVPHISAYALTVEPGTALEVLISKNRMAVPGEEAMARQFTLLTEVMESAGYEHYEISNFSLPGHHSRHNSAYWEGEHYLGLGPSAHSYNGRAREWNVSSMNEYLSGIAKEQIPSRHEILTLFMKYNEYVMTSLRTNRGADLNRIESVFGEKFSRHFSGLADRFLQEGKLLAENRVYRLSKEGKLFADGIASELFFVDEE